MNIYGMKLHELKRVDDYTLVQRIAGGWNYIYPQEKSVTFVPFNDEFQGKDKKE